MDTRRPVGEDTEAIAALIDQRLSAAERRRLLDRLDREPELYEIFVETVRSRGLEFEDVGRSVGLGRRRGRALRGLWRALTRRRA